MDLHSQPDACSRRPICFGTWIFAEVSFSRTSGILFSAIRIVQCTRSCGREQGNFQSHGDVHRIASSGVCGGYQRCSFLARRASAIGYTVGRRDSNYGAPLYHQGFYSPIRDGRCVSSRRSYFLYRCRRVQRGGGSCGRSACGTKDAS